MDEIKDIIKNVIRDMSAHKDPSKDSLQETLKQALKEKEREHCRISGIKDGSLMIIVDSPVWLYQLNLKKSKILEELKKDNPSIQTIRFKIGSFK